MKIFNKQLAGQVSVDEIANELLSTMKPEFKRAEMVAEAIIGSLLSAGKLSYVYNALKGHSNEVDFEVGDKVYCHEKIYQYVAEGDNNGTKYEQKYLAIGQAVIKDIDIYREDKIMIEYRILNYMGEIKKDTKWVIHLLCNKLSSNE